MFMIINIINTGVRFVGYLCVMNLINALKMNILK
jgi:hypothetical protein